MYCCPKCPAWGPACSRMQPHPSPARKRTHSDPVQSVQAPLIFCNGSVKKLGSRCGHKYGRVEGMRTTVDIPDPVYRRLRTRAASEGSSAKELILRGVEQVLRKSRRKSRRRVKLPIVRSKRPGTLRLDNAKIYEIISFP